MKSTAKCPEKHGEQLVARKLTDMAEHRKLTITINSFVEVNNCERQFEVHSHADVDL